MPTEPFSQFLNRGVTTNNRGQFNLALNMPSMTSPKKYVVLRSATVLQTAGEITRTSQNQREHIFDLPHPLTIWTRPLQTILHPRAGLVPGVSRAGCNWSN